LRELFQSRAIADPRSIEAIDMAAARHPQRAAELLTDCLSPQVEVDFDTGAAPVHPDLRAAHQGRADGGGAGERLTPSPNSAHPELVERLSFLLSAARERRGFDKLSLSGALTA
jgi:hypothetical protein